MTKSKKRTKTQDEKRSRLLSEMLDKWVYVKQIVDNQEEYLFLKHRIPEGGSISKIEQIILSGNPLFDGVYLITDYNIDKIYDAKSRKEIIELKMRKFDLKVGLYAEEEVTETYDQLKNHLVSTKYLTEEEFMIYCQSSKKPRELQEILMAYDDFSI